MSYLSEILDFSFSLRCGEKPSSWGEASKQFELCKTLVPKIKKMLSGEESQGCDYSLFKKIVPQLEETLKIAYSRGELKKDEIHPYYKDQMHYWYYCGFEVDRRCVKKGIGISH